MASGQAWLQENAGRAFPFSSGPKIEDVEFSFTVTDAPAPVSAVFNSNSLVLTITFDATLQAVPVLTDSLITARLKRFDPDTSPVPTDPFDPEAWFVLERFVVTPGSGTVSGNQLTADMIVDTVESGTEDSVSYSPPPAELLASGSGVPVVAFTDLPLTAKPYGPAPVHASFNTETLTMEIHFDQPITCDLPADLDAFFVSPGGKQYATLAGGTLSPDGLYLTFSCYLYNGSYLGPTGVITNMEVFPYYGAENGYLGFEFVGYPFHP